MIPAFNRMNHVVVRRLALAAGAALCMACGTKEAPTGLQPSGPTARIRFVNLINDPARIPVNAILETLPFGVNLGYAGSTPSSLPAPSTANYSAILAGDRTLVLKKTADTTVTVASGLASQSASVYVNIPPLSAYQFRAVPAGTPAANRSTSVIVSVTPTDTPTAPPLSAGTGRTFVVADKATGGSPLIAFVLTDR